ncbi:MAG: DMT family transporter [Acidobacteriota bacterium]
MKPLSDRSWIIYAAATFILYGLTNFILGYIGEVSGNNMDSSITSIFLLWSGMGLLGSILILSPAVSFNKLRESFKQKTAAAGITAGITLALGMLTLKTGFISDPGSKGPIVAIASANAMLVALAAWILLKEKLTWRQFLGMFTITGGIILISLCSSSSASLQGAVFGISTLMLFGATNYLLKYAGHKGADSITITTLLWLAAGLTGVISLMTSLLSGRGLKGLNSPSLIVLSIITGLILGLGMLTLKVALKRGPAGPAIAISGSNSILVLILDLAVFGHFPNILKILGMMIVIAGIILIALSGRGEAN